VCVLSLNTKFRIFKLQLFTQDDEEEIGQEFLQRRRRPKTIIKAKCKDTLANYNYNKERESREQEPQKEGSVGKRAKSTERANEHAQRERGCEHKRPTIYFTFINMRAKYLYKLITHFPVLLSSPVLFILHPGK